MDERLYLYQFNLTIDGISHQPGESYYLCLNWQGFYSCCSCLLLTTLGPLLDPPNEDDLLVCLREIGDWYTMGLKLDIPTQMLDEIKANKGAIEQKREMFRKWLQSRSEPRWKDILSILDDLGISRPAQDIRSRYGVLIMT